MTNSAFLKGFFHDPPLRYLVRVVLCDEIVQTVSFNDLAVQVQIQRVFQGGGMTQGVDDLVRELILLSHVLKIHCLRNIVLDILF